MIGRRNGIEVVMHSKAVAGLASAMLVAACAPYEGRYVPDCTAYAGSIVELEDSAFVWERFTDQVRIDENGNKVEAHPGYPKHGTFRKEGRALYMESSSGEPMPTMYLHKDGESYRLLTVQEQEAWEQSGQFARCALKLSAGNT